MMALLLDASVRSILIAAAVGLLLTAFRIRSGAVRHAAWTAVLMTMLSLPLLSRVVPTVAIPWPYRVASATSSGAAIAAVRLDYPNTPAQSVQMKTGNPPPGLGRSTSGAATITEITTTAPRLPAFLLAGWLAGCVVLLARVVVGWRQTRRLILTIREPPGLKPRGSDFFTSTHVAVPVTVGVWRPRVVLPADWSSWAPEKQRAALVHENSHIARHDAVIALLARINTCVFWFNPLSWWLEGRVAESAEQACDDRTVRVLGSTTTYAELLVDAARAVQHRGGRVAWQGLGIGGNGHIGSRVDRVLRGDGLREPSLLRRIVIAICCAGAIAIGVACRQAPAPLKVDPAYALDLQRQAELNRANLAASERRRSEAERQNAARLQAMTPESLAALEKYVAAKPDDVDAARTLLQFYLSKRAVDLLGKQQAQAAGQRIALRVIDRFPKRTDLITAMILKADPEGYARARALWMNHVSKPDVDATVLGHAATFFAISEKAQAEKLLLQALAMDPRYPQWPIALGRLYARAIVGSDDDATFRPDTANEAPEGHSAFAEHVRATLNATTNPTLLALTAAPLLQSGPGLSNASLGASYLASALELDPGNGLAFSLLSWPQRHTGRQDQQTLELVGDSVITKLSDRTRPAVLADLAALAYVESERSGQDQLAPLLERARGLAVESLVVADRIRSDTRFGATVYNAHVVLGVVALRKGDRETAVKEMGMAAAAPASFDVDRGQGARLLNRLTNYLLKAGERQTVIDFLEQSAALMPARQGQLLKDAQAIRAGVMPSSYQAMFTKMTS